MGQLKIELWNRGNEVYGLTFKKAKFNEKDFLKKHSKDYYELSEDSIASEIPIDGVMIMIYHNDKVVFNQNQLPEEVKLTDLRKKESYRDELSAADDEVSVIWFHDYRNTYMGIWNDVRDFKLSNLEISHITRIGKSGKEYKIFSGITYGGADADEEEIEGTPKMGYEGPYFF